MQGEADSVSGHNTCSGILVPGKLLYRGACGKICLKYVSILNNTISSHFRNFKHVICICEYKLCSEGMILPCVMMICTITGYNAM